MKEAAKLGFARAVGPVSPVDAGVDRAVAVTHVPSLSGLVADVAASGETQRRSKRKPVDGRSPRRQTQVTQRSADVIEGAEPFSCQ